MAKKAKDQITQEEFEDAAGPANYDYSEYQSEPQVDDLKVLAELATRQVMLEAQVIAAEEEVRKAKEGLRQVQEFDLPAVMDRLNLEKFSTKDGIDIEVSEKIRASIAKKNTAAAFAWLRDNGHGAIIKREIKILFGLGEEELATKFHKLMDSKQAKKLFGEIPLNLKDAESVHAGTLSSLVKALLEDGEEVPMTKLGVYRQRFSKVK